MTLQRDDGQPQPEVAALLSAVGQLLIALSGSQPPGNEPPPNQPTPDAPASPPPPGEAMEVIERVLGDARARAQQLIDESLAEARARLEALAASGAPPVEPAADGGELGAKLRSIEELLGEIDALQREQDGEPAEPAEALAGEPSEVGDGADLDPAGPAAPEEPEPAPPLDEPPAAAGEPAEEPPGEHDAGPDRLEAVTWREGESEADVVFQPEDGSVLLRVTPVEGFQGLLRVQGVLGQLPDVRQAFVEGYAEGEAQLRLTFDSPVAVGRLSEALAERLGVPVEAADVSEAERSMRFELR